VTREALELATSDGVTLEAVVDRPEVPNGALVMCHPHPQMGGTMNAPLLVAVVDDLVEAGWAVLRFNFRGIGASEGETGVGIDEIEDARAALEEARRRWPQHPVAIGGWSFGAAVAIRLANEEQDLAACVAIAPAVREKPGVTAGLPSAAEVSLEMPTLFVVGANDDVTLPADARGWAHEAGARYVEIKAANHFFWGRYEKLATEVASFLRSVIDPQ